MTDTQIRTLSLLVGDVLQDTNMSLYGSNFEALIMGTAAVETGFGYLPVDQGLGRYGVFSMRPDVHDWLKTYLYTEGAKDIVEYVQMVTCYSDMEVEVLQENMHYAIAMCALKYWVVDKEPPDSITELGKYWKEHYDGYRTSRSYEDFIESFYDFRLDNIYTNLKP